MADETPRRSLRQRKPKPADPSPATPSPTESETESPTKKPDEKTKQKKPKPTTRARVASEDGLSHWVDVLRVLTFLFIASCGLSYVISDGQSFFWGMKDRPAYLRTDWWTNRFVRPPPPVAEPAAPTAPAKPRRADSSPRKQRPLRLMTLEELAAYDGTDESKPIYLAINGTIYDVTAGRRIYGPGGSYQYFAGCDASRAYVTGCFAEDRTADMRGVEEMYLPIDDPAIDKHWSPEEFRELRRRELAEARVKVREGLKHWVDFFANSKKYPMVGKVKREKGWLKKEPRRKLCDVAQQGRSKRQIPGS